ncbi:MAG: hypothetical protein Q4B13_01755 [Lautropia sp.]|nr:hypothetical protein [Lautropia sp.]
MKPTIRPNPYAPSHASCQHHTDMQWRQIQRAGLVILLGLCMTACGQSATDTPRPAAPMNDGPPDSRRPLHTAPASDTASPSINLQPPAMSAGPNPPLTSNSPRPSSPALDQTGLCADILSTMPSLTIGTERHPLPDNPRPPLLTSTQDPVYHSCIVRITDNTAHLDSPTLRNDYSRRQAFNADNSRFLLEASDGFWHLYDARTGHFLRILKDLAGATDRLAGDAEPQWHPTDPNLLYFLPRDGIGMLIYQLDLKNNRVSVIADMGPQVRQYWPDANVASTKSEGSPSADGRYWCFMARSMVDNSHWPMRGVFTWDLQKKQIIGTLDQMGTPDHVSMSPSGKYCVISHTAATGPGTRAYRRDFRAPYGTASNRAWLQLHTTSEHSDLAFNDQRQDLYVSVDYQSNHGDVFMTNLDTGQRTPLFATYPGRTETALHISGKAYDHPGWALVSTYAEHPAEDSTVQGLHDERRQWLHRKLFAVKLTEKPEIRSIAYVNSDAFRYETEPQATVDRTFTRMLFNSTWNGSSAADQEVYLTAISGNSLNPR